jgi:hypothetical protein
LLDRAQRAVAAVVERRLERQAAGPPVCDRLALAEWADIQEHARIRKILANEIKPEFIKYIEGGKFIPKYVEVVSSTPEEILNKAG